MLTDKLKAELIAETLAWCNTIREERGQEPLKELPKGYIGDPRSCPCGKATNLSVVGMNAYGYADVNPLAPIECISVPPQVQNFIKYFDTEQIPELVEKRFMYGEPRP